MLIWLCAYYKFFCNKKVNGGILLLWLAGTSHILKKLTPEIITANNHHPCHRVDSKAISHPVAERQLEMHIAYTKLAI